ncbi:MAG: helix-turn-helix domain-containing protein [Actinobacteria bacterium]|nr:helix-turn-helix domain-containing protein [Actinomycetota bacterium]
MAESNDPVARGDLRSEIKEFLSTRRARITPAQAGLPDYGGGRRRVAGLRREEVALLAGISSEYYTRLERGNATGVSESVVEAIARALQLDGVEREHLVRLIRTAGTKRQPRRRPGQQRVRTTVQRILDSMLGSAAFVLNSRGDILAANRLGQVLMSPVYEMSPPNMTRFVFLDPGATTFFRDWHKVATDTVAILRAEAGRDPFNKNLTDLVGELSTRSDEFRVRWAAHDVQVHTSGTKLLHHPVVGDLDIQFESMPLPGDTDQSLLIYTAEPSSPSQDALALLASWAATPAALPGDSATEDSTETASKHSSET